MLHHASRAEVGLFNPKVAGSSPARPLARRVNASPQNMGAFITAVGLPPDRSYEFSQVIKVTDQGTELSWVYFIDKTAYDLPAHSPAIALPEGCAKDCAVGSRTASRSTTSELRGG